MSTKPPPAPSLARGQQRLAAVTAGAFGLATALFAAAGVAAVNQLVVWDRVRGDVEGGRRSEQIAGFADIVAAEDRYVDLERPAFFVGLLAFVLLAAWAFRALRRATTAGADLRLAPAWALLAWFVPLGQVLLPFLVLADVHRTHEPGLPRPIGRGHRRGKGSRWLWVGWPAALLWAVFQSRRADLGENLALGRFDELSTFFEAALIADIFGVVGMAAMARYVWLVRQRAERSDAVALGAGDGKAAGWYPDPTRRHQHRYFDGAGWTQHVSSVGHVSVDPV